MTEIHAIWLEQDDPKKQRVESRVRHQDAGEGVNPKCTPVGARPHTSVAVKFDGGIEATN